MFFNVINERLINFDFFFMIVLSDVQLLYMHTFLSIEFVLNWVNFYLKSVNFLFCSVYIIGIFQECKGGIEKFYLRSALFGITGLAE